MYSQEEHLEVFEVLRDACDLREYPTRLGRFPTNLATDLGLVLGTLHSARSLAGTTGHIERRDAPWPLTLHRPNFALYERMSNANVQLVSTMQGFPAFGMLLDALRARWPEFVVDEAGVLGHYDIKLETVLVMRVGSWRTRGIRLVDWELAGRGHPARAVLPGGAGRGGREGGGHDKRGLNVDRAHVSHHLSRYATQRPCL